MRTTTILAATVLSVAVGGAALSNAAAFAATGSGHCPTLTQDSIADWQVIGGATVTLLDKGVKIVTPETPSAASWARTVDVPMKHVQQASYQTYKYDSVAPAALAAYRITLDVDDDGTADGTIVYEPYYQIVGNPAQNTAQTWQVLTGKFWTSSTAIAGMTAEPGGSYAGNKTWAQILAANPEAQVLGYAIGQGTYNAGASDRVNEVRFQAKGFCKKHEWKKPPVPTATATPSATATASPTMTATPTATATATPTTTGSPTTTASPTASPTTTAPTVTASPSATTSPTPGVGVTITPVDNSTNLPKTGPGVVAMVGVGAVLLGAGAVAWLLARRRRIDFTA